MSATTQIITCDGCNRDLTTTSNSVAYRLILKVENIPSRGGWVTAMMAYPPITEPMHFCNLSCLDKWHEEWAEKRRLAQEQK